MANLQLLMATKETKRVWNGLNNRTLDLFTNWTTSIQNLTSNTVLKIPVPMWKMDIVNMSLLDSRRGRRGP
ncbi:hypothetical protein CEXT_600621 [Caerostris extrusa]|uniref:Uncharacterized protein n=1 Tax=Caerostris extrusa TaxID=172846 RepID=A0AAV4XX25_CAEEX|nr:hypothetical protein CEXT_600621 [Caerostris extrusa]